ncbi:hypothetical protein GLE_0637 [Lysobacter enzymogenes]|uniref:Uncharacterized protein n=1 Tax=Lysobacter enzymogenes TaxID=69 RepID=A0A0S2DBT4_LYSEN|nr:hypothetical protein GLE_0637 [Lysobacter enzymogenes]
MLIQVKPPADRAGAAPARPPRPPRLCVRSARVRARARRTPPPVTAAA